MVEVAVVDYGLGNLLSVSRALTHCGARVNVTSDPSEILSCGRVVLPGVGAFANGMAALCARGLDTIVRKVASQGTPLLGICLGMQMLMEASEEFGETAGLGLIPGRVQPIPTFSTSGAQQKIPHIGWNQLVHSGLCENWQGTLLSEIEPGAAVYFVHSFMAVPTSPNHRLADCIYGGNRVAAVIARDSIMGCQFHPEKSGEIGLQILTEFLREPLAL